MRAAVVWDGLGIGRLVVSNYEVHLLLLFFPCIFFSL